MTPSIDGAAVDVAILAVANHNNGVNVSNAAIDAQVALVDARLEANRKKAAA